MIKIKVVLTGATGMVGEGVLHECLMHSQVEEVLVVNRRPCGVSHSKLIEIIHEDWFNLTPIREYTKLTYDLTLHMAELLAELNKEMVSCYVSGDGTDSTERGRRMWARVKSQTENSLLRLPFKSAFMFRPGYIHPTKGMRNTHHLYVALSWLYPALPPRFP